MIGLSGSHRVGKTTLAKRYSEEFGLPFVETNASGVYLELGLSPQIDYDFATTLVIQLAILESLLEAYAGQHGRNFITDRTPIDLLAYTMADIRRSNVTSKETDAFMEYRQKCFEAANRYFAVIVIVQPGIPLVDDPTKAPPNIAYMNHINTLLMGLVTDSSMKAGRFFINKETLKIEDRMDSISYSIDRVYNHHKNEMTNLGGSFH